MSESRLALPLFVADGDNIMVFRDVATAEGKLEEVDVDDGAFVGWDAEGHLLQFGPVPSSRLGVRDVSIVVKEPRAIDADGLRQRLSTVLETYGGQSANALPLTELVRRFIEWAGYTR